MNSSRRRFASFTLFAAALIAPSLALADIHQVQVGEHTLSTGYIEEPLYQSITQMEMSPQQRQRVNQFLATYGGMTTPTTTSLATSKAELVQLKSLPKSPANQARYEAASAIFVQATEDRATEQEYLRIYLAKLLTPEQVATLQ